MVSYLTGAAGAERRLPTHTPDLPVPVTAVWIASLLTVDEPLGVRWDGERWSFFASWGDGIDDPVPPDH